MSYKQKVKKLWNDRDNQKNYFKWLMIYSKPYMGQILLLMSIKLAGIFASIYMAILSQKAIDAATADNASIVAPLVGYVVLMLALQASVVIYSLINTMLNEKYGFGIRKQVYDKILDSVWMETQKYHTGDLMTRMTSDAGIIADGVITVIPGIVSLLIELVAVFGTLFAYSHFLAVSALFMAPFAVVLSFFLGRIMKRLQIKVQESETAYRSFIQESLANILIVKSFANEKMFSDELSRLREERFGWIWKKSKVSLGSSAVIGIAFQLGYILAFAYGVIQISKGEITYGTMTVFLTLFNRVMSPVVELASQLPKVVSILASAGRVMELQNLEEEKRTGTGNVDNSVGVDVTDMSFGYNRDIVIENSTFNIKPGQFVAIVGESGIGKTTLIRILLGFVNINSGSISYYDRDSNTTNINADVRKFISYVPQGNTLFSGTIKRNLLMGKINASEEEIQKALEVADCLEFINEMPDGLDTIIGEKGMGLSEGQAQRIAIARALIRKSPFIIFDEATSALDENTELNVINNLKDMTPRPTCLFITHRRSVLKYCDRQFRIENRCITEEAVNDKNI
ncbi:MAG: ABC transporter ATP-binding protein/permease [Butyrivibrio sp.]|nr:ABC transporter ATP-binding protein/permease [Butyrivibrio sp.]